MKTVYIIHGWDGSPNEPMYRWLRRELTSRGFKVVIPEMPNPEKPDIESWVKKINETVECPDKNTILVGHSIGCQAILRYLEKLDSSVFVGDLILIAPWFTLQNLESEEEHTVVKPWIETKINFFSVTRHVSKITAIFSDSDPFVPLENVELFKKNLETENIIEHNKGHFIEEDGVTELPSALEAILKIK